MAKFPTYEEMGKKVAEEALDGYIYKGKTVREWIDILAQTQWIPVSERLPETDGDYLLFGKVVEDDTEDIFIGTYDACAEEFGYWEDYYDSKTLGFLDSELIEYNKVIAWMPLPEPYKAESEE